MTDSVTFDALGQVQEMRLTTRAGCKLEAALGMPFPRLLQEMDRELGFRTLTVVFTACLNNGNGVPEKRAQEVLDDIGGLARGAELLGQMVQASLPEPGDDSGNAATGAA